MKKMSQRVSKPFLEDYPLLPLVKSYLISGTLNNHLRIKLENKVGFSILLRDPARLALETRKTFCVARLLMLASIKRIKCTKCHWQLKRVAMVIVTLLELI